MSGPDTPRWLSEISAELRQEVPVRDAWRARLLDDVAQAPRPTADDGPLTIARDRQRRIVLRPLTGLAAAVLFAALGAGAALLVQSRRASRVEVAQSESPAAGRRGAVSPVSDASFGTARDVVRFELSAPNATRVALVGSFNGWNPVATPLRRDASTGTWAVSLRLPPGRHVYAFVVDGDVTADPAAPRAADDDFGSAKSVLLVSGPRT